jgi:hypothetical protein
VGRGGRNGRACSSWLSRNDCVVCVCVCVRVCQWCACVCVTPAATAHHCCSWYTRPHPLSPVCLHVNHVAHNGLPVRPGWHIRLPGSAAASPATRGPQRHARRRGVRTNAQCASRRRRRRRSPALPPGHAPRCDGRRHGWHTRSPAGHGAAAGRAQGGGSGGGREFGIGFLCACLAMLILFHLFSLSPSSMPAPTHPPPTTHTHKTPTYTGRPGRPGQATNHLLQGRRRPGHRNRRRV